MSTEQEVIDGTSGFKYLRLISPEVALSLGLESEAPVFISPYVNKQENCGDCGVAYGPLIYKMGEVVPHHFHYWLGSIAGNSQYFSNGGIFYFAEGNEPSGFTQWVAAFKVQGRRTLDSAEKVYIDEIQAFCQCCNKGLSEGFVYEPNHKASLYPVCHNCADKRDKLNLKFEFKVTKSGILFSQL